MTYCSVVTALVLVGLTKKRFGHYAILKRRSYTHDPKEGNTCYNMPKTAAAYSSGPAYS